MKRRYSGGGRAARKNKLTLPFAATRVSEGTRNVKRGGAANRERRENPKRGVVGYDRR